MTATTIRVQMAQRKDTAANWTAANPILLSGEIGYETDTKKFKIGDGTSNWNTLAYLPIPDGSGNLTITGNLEIGTTGSLTFEGSTADGFETTLAVTNPTADRTITLPDRSGTVITSGDTGTVTSTMLVDGTIVNADISATAEIAVSKLANGTANQVLVTDGTDVSWSDNLTLAGNLTVNGTTTTIDSQTLLVEDKNIEMGVVATPTDVTADGGGITLRGTTNKTINWIDSTDSWTSSEHVDLASGKSYRINNTEVLSSTTLGSGVTGSSLTSVGTIGTGVWQGTAINATYLDATLVKTSDTGTVTSTMIADGTIVNADVNASAAIAGTKISPDFGSQNVTTTGTSTAASFIPTSSTAPTNGLYLSAANSVALSTNGTGRLFISSAGLVGVGASSPGDVLHVKGGSTYAGVIADNSAATGGGAFRAYRNGAQKAIFCVDSWVTGTSSDDAAIYADAGGGIKFYTNNSSTAKAVLTSGGLLGIGTTTPSTQLEVVGGINATDNTVTMRTVPAGTVGYFGTTTNHPLGFRIQDSEKARIDTSGRLLVGTSSSIESTSKLQVKDGSLNIYHANAAAGAGYAILFTTDGSSSALAQAKIEGLQETANTSGGRLVFSTSASGSGSPTERIRITSGGWLKASNTGTYTYSQAMHEVRSDNNDFTFTATNTNASPNGIQIYHVTDANGTGNEFLYCYAGNTLRASIRSDGGLANFSANNANLSDRNAKKDISLAADTWDCIKQWEIVNYRYKDQPDDTDLNLGVIAQQVAESCPEVITVFEEAKDDQPEKLGVKEQQMYWMAIKALQEAQVRIEALEAEVAALKAQ